MGLFSLRWSALVSVHVMLPPPQHQAALVLFERCLADLAGSLGLSYLGHDLGITRPVGIVADLNDYLPIG